MELLAVRFALQSPATHINTDTHTQARSENGCRTAVNPSPVIICLVAAPPSFRPDTQFSLSSRRRACGAADAGRPKHVEACEAGGSVLPP